MKLIQGNIVDINSRRIFPGSITVSDGGKISCITSFSVGKALNNKMPYIMCGFIDSHVHIELSNILPSEYAKVSVSHGVIGCVTDSHEVANIDGKQGVISLIKSVKGIPFYFGFSAPSCIIPDKYSLDDIDDLLSMNEVTHLGEMMDFPSVILHEPLEERKILLSKKYSKPVDGHAPGLTHLNLQEYVESGISTDHECETIENVYEKLEHNLKVQIKIKNTSDLLELLPALKEYPDKIMFCSDSMSCIDFRNGYLDRVASEAIKAGYDLFDVLQALCINPVKHYKLKCGLLRSGDSADFIIVDNLENFHVKEVYHAGDQIYDDQKEISFPSGGKLTEFDGHLTNSHIDLTQIEVKCTKLISRVNCICCYNNEKNTVRKVEEMACIDGLLQSDIPNDVLKLVLYSRDGSFKPQIAFVNGFGLKSGAFASSISHDTHNILAVGTNDADIVTVINGVLDNKGGITVAEDTQLVAEMPLPVGGLMSFKSYQEIASVGTEIIETLKHLGCILDNPVETLSVLAHSIIPTIKITPDGLLDVARQEILPLFDYT